MNLSQTLMAGTVLSVLTLCGCGEGKQDQIHYSKEQIEQLRLDSTQALPLERSGMVDIDLNDVLESDSFSLDNLIDSARIVLLETNEKSVINNISKIVFGEQYIYVMDDYQGNSVAIFDRQGNFVRRLAHGKGHGELFRLYDIDYDGASHKLVAQASRRISPNCLSSTRQSLRREIFMSPFITTTNMRTPCRTAVSFLRERKHCSLSRLLATTRPWCSTD